MESEFVVKDEHHLILCPRTEDMERPAAYARSMIAECGCEVWIAQSSQDMIESELPTQVACIQHAIPAMERYKVEYPDEKIELRMAPGAKEEVRQEFEVELNIPIPTLTEEEYDKYVKDER